MTGENKSLQFRGQVIMKYTLHLRDIYHDFKVGGHNRFSRIPNDKDLLTSLKLIKFTWKYHRQDESISAGRFVSHPSFQP